jgi:AraC-like DNA-binding protein
MSVVFRPGDESAAAREDYWRHALGETLGQVDLRPPAGDVVPLQLSVGDVGSVRFAAASVSWHASAARCVATRTSKHISGPDQCMGRIDVVASGRMAVEQDGRQAELGPGDFAFVDMSRPARWATAADDWFAVTFPRTLLPLSRADMAKLTGTRIPGDRGTGALVSSFARQVAGQLDDFRAADGARVGTALLDLVSAALAGRLDRADRLPPSSRQHALLLRVQAGIEAQLGDPRLSPGAIAAAHHISVRHLYQLFEEHGQGVAGWIRQRRLEHCRRDLLDPALLDRPAAAIGARWGLVSPAHFSRVFRASYGLPPAEYRTAGTGPGPLPALAGGEHVPVSQSEHVPG